MADAWVTLLAGSTIPSGDAWEHLNAQDGGGSSCDLRYVATHGMRFNIKSRSVKFDYNKVSAYKFKYIER